MFVFVALRLTTRRHGYEHAARLLKPKKTQGTRSGKLERAGSLKCAGKPGEINMSDGEEDRWKLLREAASGITLDLLLDHDRLLKDYEALKVALLKTTACHDDMASYLLDTNDWRYCECNKEAEDDGSYWSTYLEAL